MFALSRDGAGKWGLADRISEHHARYCTSANLRDANADRLAPFEKWVAATFAFVPACILAKEERGSYADLFAGASWRTWLRHFRRDAAARRCDDGFVPRLQPVPAVPDWC